MKQISLITLSLFLALCSCNKNPADDEDEYLFPSNPAAQAGHIAALSHISVSTCEIPSALLDKHDAKIKTVLRESTRETHKIYWAIPWLFDKEYDASMDLILKRKDEIILTLDPPDPIICESLISNLEDS